MMTFQKIVSVLVGNNFICNFAKYTTFYPIYKVLILKGKSFVVTMQTVLIVLICTNLRRLHRSKKNYRNILKHRIEIFFGRST